MATRHASKTQRRQEASQFKMLPDPPRFLDDMQESFHVADALTILRSHFAPRSDAFVGGAGYLCHDTRNRSNWLVPDCLVAFGVDPEYVLGRNGYVISEVGKPPDFVLEVASESTGREDYTRKRDGFAAYGVAEYWRFDPSGGDYHDQPLAGDQLVDDVYRPIELIREPGGVTWGHSRILGLDLCWEDGRLRFYDPVSRSFLRTLDESEDALATTAALVESERAARLTAEAEVRRLEEQVQRLREK